MVYIERDGPGKSSHVCTCDSAAMADFIVTQLNGNPQPIRVIIAVEDGMIRGVRANVPVEFAVFDQDGVEDGHERLQRDFDIPGGEDGLTNAQVDAFWENQITKQYPVAVY